MAAQADGISHTELLSEDELKRMSRQVKELIPNDTVDEDEIINVRHIFNQIFSTASSPLTAPHRVAAWNTLCAFIDGLARSDVKSIRNLLWGHNIWHNAYHLYTDESQYARPKSAKQLLLTVVNALRTGDVPIDVQELMGERSLEHLLNDSDPRKTKAFLQLLTQLFSRDLVNVSAIDRVLMTHSNLKAKSGPWSGQDYSIDSFLACLFRWASYEDLGPVVSRTISVALDKHGEVHDRQDDVHDRSSVNTSEPVWGAALRECLRSGECDIDQLRNQVFPVLFKRGLSQYLSFLRAHGLEEFVSRTAKWVDRSNQLLFASLLSGKELGLVRESNETGFRDDGSTIYMPVRSYGPLLRSPTRSTRITGLSLLVSSHSATRPFLPSALALFKNNLPSYLADTNANFRSELFSLVQRLMDRLRAITALLARTSDVATRKGEAHNSPGLTYQQHRKFLDWLLRTIKWELRPTASYQRHISALRILSIIARSGVDYDVPIEHWSKSASVETKWPFSLSILRGGLRQLLLSLLMDPFDDVRQTAASILSMYAGPGLGIGPQYTSDSLENTITQAEKLMLASGRADQADGVAHMYSLLAQMSSVGSVLDLPVQSENLNVLSQLIKDLEKMLDRAQDGLATAAKRYPMHGVLTSVRYVLTQRAAPLRVDELDRLASCLHRVWETVRPVLCNDAPEGYEPDDYGDSAVSSSKDTLSYCWRALKESSLLLGTLVAEKTVEVVKVSSLGHLCFSQLAELRHRGAFSTVAQTWITCCNRVATLPDGQESKRLLEQWYTQAFGILKNRTTINTRRSAGIPSLLCGLLVADKTGPLLARAFEDLSTIAQQPVDTSRKNESSLPQVHSLNCVKDILKNTRLGEQSERFIPASLRLAAQSLRSEAWAIQNCGLMLFRGVIDRLLGTSDAYLEGDGPAQQRISAQQHPGLLDTVLELLNVVQSRDGDKPARVEGVFPALQMLQRIHVPPGQKQGVLNALLALTASPSWHVREKAARTLAALLSDAGPMANLDTILEERVGHENALHATLLCLKHMTRAAITVIRRHSRRTASTAQNLERLLLTVLPALKTSWANRYHSHAMTRATYIDTLMEYTQLKYRIEHSHDAQLKAILEGHDPCLYTTHLSISKFHLDLFGEALKANIEAPASEPPEGGLELACAARASACQLLLGQQDPFQDTVSKGDPVETLLLLAHHDADASVEFWKALCADDDAFAAKSKHLDSLILPVAAITLSDSCQVRVKVEVQRFLLYLADNGVALHKISQTCSESSSPWMKDSNEMYADQWLQLRALVLDDQLSRNELIASELQGFISSCKTTITKYSFFSREAAILALSRVQNVWSFVAERTDALARDAYLTIYDLLNDDDEDIRLLAAQITSRILQGINPSARETHFEPITASQRLLAHIVTQLGHSRAFALEAFTRAYNTDEVVVDQLDAFSRRDTALFATEKQNLYIDTAREVRAWSQVLLLLPPSSIPRRLIRDLTMWVDEGLYTLTARLSKGQQTDDNGALGWTSNAEVFTLGLQVVYGIEVLMRYLAKGGKLPMEGSEIVRRMVLFGQALADVEGEGNVLWKWEVERVLGEIVLGRLELAWELAGMAREVACAQG